MKELTTALEKHYKPKRIVIVERFYFHRRNQLSGESVWQYIAELRRLATHYNCGVGLDEALPGRFVCGINDKRTQKRLLTEEDLTLAKAVALAQGTEAAEINAQQFKEPEIAVKAIGAANKRKEPCLRCGKESHVSERCHYKQVTCHKCSKIGHLARLCSSQGLKGGVRSQWVQCADQDEKVEGMMFLLCLQLEETILAPLW